MPTYEYECSRGHQFEAEQRISDPPLSRCRVCRAKARRLISRTSFVLKGGGWYSDGYGAGKDGGSGGESKPGESKPADGKSGESKGTSSASSTAGSGEGSSSAPTSPSKHASTPDSSR
jgi:putative FmdB family regulatory protein